MAWRSTLNGYQLTQDLQDGDPVIIQPGQKLPVLDGSQLTNVQTFRMSAIGNLRLASGLGVELCRDAVTVVRFAAVRECAGTSGSTVIELEVNGVATGDTLTWASSDVDNTVKSAAISIALAQDDRVSFRITSFEPGSQTIYASLV